MNRFLIRLYDMFERRRALLWSLLAVTVAVMALCARNVRFTEDLSSFFPDDDTGRLGSVVFENLRVKDRIVAMVSATSDEADADTIAEWGDTLAERLAEYGGGSIDRIVAAVDAERMERMISLVYDRLPIYLTEEDYARIDSLVSEEGVAAALERDRRRLASPLGIALRRTVMRDPLGIASPQLAVLQQLGSIDTYELYGDRIFADSLRTMMIMIDPAAGSSTSGDNDRLVAAVERAAAETERLSGGSVKVEYFGAPAMSVYNARRIKKDTMLTLTLALLAVIALIVGAFRSRWSVLLIVLPVGFGALFALAVAGLTVGSLSSIAMGAGAAVFGIALSYSIHVVSHANHTRDVRRIIGELAYPLTVGSFTTIGAFLGLMLTSSQLLRDFGLFSALTLVGTTVFCLVFLPHMLGSDGGERKKLLRVIERANAYRFDRNRPLVWAIVLLTAVCACYYSRVSFDSDMMNLNYTAPHLAEAERHLARISGDSTRTVIVAAVSGDGDRAARAYGTLAGCLDGLQREGAVAGFASAAGLVVPTDVQRERVERWREYWTADRRREVLERIDRRAESAGFAEGVFADFGRVLDRDYEVTDFGRMDADGAGALGDWVSGSDSVAMFVAQVSLREADRERVYEALQALPDVMVIDRGYYAGLMAESVGDNFNLALLISSLLISAALLVCYGRIELAAISFLPMMVSWIIILGAMALLGVEFNIVNIILSTFIFGIGDDFSIFIMDGLQSEYATGCRMLPAHKTAIFFSAFTTVAGMGALVFAVHPALRSISVISILGMAAVVLVAYTVQPLLFRALISRPVERGGFPVTLAAALRSAALFAVFVAGCFALQVYRLLLAAVPVSRRRRRAMFHNALCGMSRFIVRAAPSVRSVGEIAEDERFERPAVITANHESFADILRLLSLTPRMVMITNSWVWHSPLFGRIVRYAGFYHAADGYERLADTLRPLVDEGYSVAVFPEGTRSADGRIGRFHKGAFLLAERLGLEILPVAMYGNGMVVPRRQQYLLRKGVLAMRVGKRIAPDGTDYRTRAREVRRWTVESREELRERYGRADNPYFYDALIKNYIYKGPVLEWYMRVKVRMERCYDRFDRLLPREGTIVDVGCGYGPLTFMLSMLSERRRMIGIDYDEEKILTARRSLLCSDRTRFECADAARYELPYADAFVLNDMLHYLEPEQQELLLRRCLDRVAAGGTVIVRDGDGTISDKHRLTRLTERFSTRILGFNKTEGELHFPSGDTIGRIAAEAGFSVERQANDTHTSNTIYILRRCDGRIR